MRLLSTALIFRPSLWQEELEHLNQASEEINQVELQLDVSVIPFLHPLELVSGGVSFSPCSIWWQGKGHV